MPSSLLLSYLSLPVSLPLFLLPIQFVLSPSLTYSVLCFHPSKNPQPQPAAPQSHISPLTPCCYFVISNIHLSTFSIVTLFFQPNLPATHSTIYTPLIQICYPTNGRNEPSLNCPWRQDTVCISAFKEAHAHKRPPQRTCIHMHTFQQWNSTKCIKVHGLITETYLVRGTDLLIILNMEFRVLIIAPNNW